MMIEHGKKGAARLRPSGEQTKLALLRNLVAIEARMRSALPACTRAIELVRAARQSLAREEAHR